MNKKIGVAVWALGLALSNLLLFVLEKGMTATFWITFVFVWLAFLSSLIFQLWAAKRFKTSDGGFLHIPAILMSLIYEAIQIGICVIFALGSTLIPSKLALLIHGVLLIITWALVLLSLGGNDHIKKVNGRQKSHHTEL